MMLGILGFGTLGKGFVDLFIHTIGSAIAAGVRSIAAWAMNTFLHALVATTMPHLTGGWFSGAWKGEVAVALAFAAPCILAGAIQSLIHGEPGDMAMRLVSGTAIVVVVLGAGRVIIEGLIVAVNGACTMLLDLGAGGPAHVVAVWGTVVALKAAGGMLATQSAGPAVLIGIVIILTALAIWIELATRMALIYLLVAFAPLAVVGVYWHWGARWARRLGEVLVAVVLSQLVITTVFVIGTDAMAGVGTSVVHLAPGAAVGALATAVGMMLLGTVALPVALRVAPHVTTSALEAGSVPLGAAAARIKGSASRLTATKAGGGGPDGGGGGDGPGGSSKPLRSAGPRSVAAAAGFAEAVVGEARHRAGATSSGRVVRATIDAGKFRAPKAKK